MKKFSNTDPVDLLNDPRIVFQGTTFVQHKNDNDYLFWLKDSEYLIWAAKSNFVYIDDNGVEVERRVVGGTRLEIPKEGLSWFIWVIEEKFFKTEAEGGLAKGQFGYEEEIKGERLIVSRMFGTPGYSFRNHSRDSYVFKTQSRPQEAIFTDEMLFEQGMFDEFKKLAEKIEKGII